MPTSDPQWLADGKKMPAGNAAALCKAGVMMASLPLYFATVFPVTVVAQTVRFLTKKKLVIRHKPSEGADRVTISPGEFVAREKRAYDVVVLGSTGFTGKLLVKYLAKTYGDSSVKWAIAGRRQNALDDIKTAINMPHLPTIICDTNNTDNLRDLVKDTRAVVTTAGPFNEHGTPVVKYCANFGTHYADITGETVWVREMVDRFDAIAKETGARIVHYCGHDSVPWDLMTMLAADKLKKEQGSELASVKFFDRLNAGPSGGTVATLFSILFAESKYVPSVNFDPITMTHKGENSWAQTTHTGLKSVGYSAEEKTWAGMFVMTNCNFNAVKRSNALNGYGEAVTYYEALVHTGFGNALQSFLGLLSFGAVVVCPPLLSLLRKYVLPKPGSGPSEKAMDAGWLEVTCYAQGTKEASKVKGAMYLRTDPGYRDTARMLAEAGLTLALTDPSKLPGAPGVLTPASGIGQPYVDRLCATGTKVTWY